MVPPEKRHCAKCSHYCSLTEQKMLFCSWLQVPSYAKRTFKNKETKISFCHLFWFFFCFVLAPFWFHLTHYFLFFSQKKKECFLFIVKVFLQKKKIGLLCHNKMRVVKRAISFFNLFLLFFCGIFMLKMKSGLTIPFFQVFPKRKSKKVIIII